MRRVAISASSAPGAAAGAAAADAGGNAVDAALAATMSAMISDPGIIGPGAGCFITIWPESGDPVVIDAYAAMPGLGAGLPASFGDRIHMEYGGGMDTLVGPCSVAVPGAWSGFGRASERFGAVAWAQLLQPAIELAGTGFPLSGVSEAYLSYSHEPIYDLRPDSFAALHHADGTRVADGDPIEIEGLAESLTTIADEGPDSFYTGSIGQRLVAAMEEWGGNLTARDLAEYAAIERQPIEIAVGGWKVATNPAPAIGGAVLGALLLLLEAGGFDSWEDGGPRLMAEIQRSVLGYRARELDAAGDVGDAIETLLDAARFGDHRRLASSPSTIHVSAVDSAGQGCSITTSAGYGSGVMIPGTGLWLNNSLGEVELFPGGMEGFAPGDRLPSNMAPTIAASTSGAVLAVGSPGASRITTSLAQVLTNFIRLEMSVTDSILHPRLHVEVFEGAPTIAHEPGIHVEAFDDLVVRRFPDRSMYFGGVGLAMHDPGAGLYEVADPVERGRPRSGACDVISVPEFLSIVLDPVRLAILGAAAHGPVDVTALADALGLAERKLQKEVGKLAASGLIDDERCLNVELLRELARSLPSEAPVDPSLLAGPWTSEEATVLSRFFTGRRLGSIPSATAKRRLVLERLALEFEPGLRYQEREVDFALQMFYADYAALRRYLVDEGFLTRADGVYWRTGGRVAGPTAAPADRT